MKRKDFLQTTAAVVGGSLLPATSLGSPLKKKILRVAHLSDIHVKPGIIPESGMAKALHHVQQLRDKIDFIINGGDAIMDALAVSRENTQVQFDLFKSILQKDNSLPVYHTIGNHDVWGWFIKENRPENDPLYGK